MEAFSLNSCPNNILEICIISFVEPKKASIERQSNFCWDEHCTILDF